MAIFFSASAAESRARPRLSSSWDKRPARLRSKRVKAGLRCLAAAALLSALSLPICAASLNSPARKQEARQQFEKAEQMREALNGRPAEQRTRKDYLHVANAYREVYYLCPASSKADASIVAVAETLAEMGRQFQPGEKAERSAIRQYEFLRHQYPGSKYRFQALFTIGQIYKQDLRDNDSARATFEEFLRRYPRNSLAPQAKQALADLNQPTAAPPPAEESAAAQKTDTPAGETPVSVTTRRKSALTRVTGIRHWSTPDYTRVAIDVDGEVKYEAGRVPNPDRIFFDLQGTRLTSTLAGKSFAVQDGFLKKIRVAQYRPDSVRVVLEVADVADYSAFLLPNPYRLIIDIHGRQRPPQRANAGGPGPQSQTLTAKTKPAGGDEGAITGVGEEKSYRSVEKANEAAPSARQPDGVATAKKKIRHSDEDSAATQKPARSASSALSTKAVPRTVVDDETDESPGAAPARGASSATTDATKSDDPLFSGSGDAAGPELKATKQPTTAPTAVAVAPRAKTSKKKNARLATGKAPATHEAEPTSFGDRSLTRTLGLKLGRIVLDAGHGGYDTGTIGPDGLMEKEVVLDVTLRLGGLLERRLGADVIYTRDDDTFIPLETRTAIANQHQADLFISIHANSSNDPAARGVETYFLNFTSDAHALEVAARENAVSQKSIFELQDLVKKIALKDKIDESRELATDVQRSLYSGLATRHSTLRNRGVKQAPFVVLIGANMPSILAEISFLSNPTDEAKLETPAYRQKIAEALYKGIAKYANGLSGIKVASKLSKNASQ